jgi:AcrR family transcriptional regulator
MSELGNENSRLVRQPRKSERTREAILKAAQALFGELGYDRATVRDIAARAAIDPAMVIRYFGSKEALFARATVFDLRLPELNGIRPEQLGETLIRHFLAMWEGPSSNGSLTILMRAAASSEEAAEKTRAVFAGQVLPMLAQVADPRELPMRAGLVSSQLLGLALCRYVLKVPPVVAMSPDAIVANIGPVLQGYITGALRTG